MEELKVYQVKIYLDIPETLTVNTGFQNHYFTEMDTGNRSIVSVIVHVMATSPYKATQVALDNLKIDIKDANIYDVKAELLDYVLFCVGCPIKEEN